MPEMCRRPAAARLPFALLCALGLLLAPQAARAETREVDCAHLRGAVEAASGTQTIILAGMCTKAALGEADIAIPAALNLTLRGAPGTVSGIDGIGKTGVLLQSTEAGALAIEDLTFENARTAGAVRLRARRILIARDSFLTNSSTEASGAGLFAQTIGSGCPGSGGPPTIELLSSTFRANTLTHDGEAAMGAGAYLDDVCAEATDTIEGNDFEGNLIGARNAEQAAGGGLFLGAEGAAPASVSQASNTFEGNRVEDDLAPHSYTGGRFGGGGEWLEGATLLSVRDRFSGNAVEGATGAHPSGGAALGIAPGVGALESVQTVTCGHGVPAGATLEDDVIEGNRILGGEPAGAGGAAIQIGCGESGGQLTLLDSTLSGNSSPAGGVEGVAGGAEARLVLANAILWDGPGEELRGFGAAGGSITASHSDVCAGGGSEPLAGDRDICANPLLAGSMGAPADATETDPSPTREAGSNALVPATLTTDYYGRPRIAGGIFDVTCREGLGEIAPPVVDIGAAESPEALIRPLRVRCPRPFARSAFVFPRVTVLRGGVLLLTFQGLDKGTVLAQAHTRLRQGARLHSHRVHRTVIVNYGQASRTGALPSTLRLRIRPTRRALRALHPHKRLFVSLSVTYAADRLFPVTQTRTVTVARRG